MISLHLKFKPQFLSGPPSARRKQAKTLPVGSGKVANAGSHLPSCYIGVTRFYEGDWREISRPFAASLAESGFMPFAIIAMRSRCSMTEAMIHQMIPRIGISSAKTAGSKSLFQFMDTPQIPGRHHYPPSIATSHDKIRAFFDFPVPSAALIDGFLLAIDGNCITSGHNRRRRASSRLR